MILTTQDIEQRLVEKFGNRVSDFRMEQDIFTLHADKAAIKEIISCLHEDEELSFNFLTDLCGVHYPDTPEAEYAVVYMLHNWVDNIRIRVKAFLPSADLGIDSVIDVFEAANWMERETFDFFGIKFLGHPKLKKILNDEGMVSFPMRKEYPMEDSERTDKDDRFFGRIPNNAQRNKN